MRVYITDAEKFDKLSYVVACQEQTQALLERWGADTHFEYSAEIDAYKCTQEYFDFFSNFIIKQEQLDTRIDDLNEKWGDAVHDAINAANIDNADAEQHHIDLEQCLNDFESLSHEGNNNIN